MPNISMTARIVCPYFQHLGKISIVCEGVEMRGTIKLTFASAARRDKWATGHCERYDSGGCPVAAIIGRKYGEGED